MSVTTLLSSCCPVNFWIIVVFQTMNCVFADFGWACKQICGELKKIFFHLQSHRTFKFAQSLHTHSQGLSLSSNVFFILFYLSSLTYSLTCILSLRSVSFLEVFSTQCCLLSHPDSVYFIDFVFASSSGSSLPYCSLCCVVMLVSHFPPDILFITFFFNWHNPPSQLLLKLN